MGQWAKANGYGGGIAYVLEAGDDFSDEANHLLSYAAKVQLVADAYQWKSHAFVPKDAGSPFHAPDLFAWEWGKYMQETVMAKKRPMRRSLLHLVGPRLQAYKFLHLTGEPLLRFFNQVRDLGLEQLQEDAAALSSVVPTDVSEAVDPSGQKEPVGDPE